MMNQKSQKEQAFDITCCGERLLSRMPETAGVKAEYLSDHSRHGEAAEKHSFCGLRFATRKPSAERICLFSRP
jgi:hypothetical protein